MNNSKLSTCSTAKVPSIPLEDFFRNPEKSSFQLSPEGGFISYMKPWEEGNRRMNIFVKSMSEDTEIQLTKEKDRSITKENEKG